MNLEKKIIQLKKRGIVTEKPHPIIPFILGFIILGLAIYGRTLGNKSLNYFMYSFSAFTFLFAVGHWFVARVIKKNKR